MTLRRMKHNSPMLLLIALPLALSQRVTLPSAAGPTPSRAQLAWQQLEYYAFIHFGMNTFTDHEWGEGRASADNFNPTALDCRQWARVVNYCSASVIVCQSLSITTVSSDVRP